jgi:hypothetical protein
MRLRGQRDRISVGGLHGREFAGCVEHRISHRTDVRVNPPQVAQHVEVQRRGLNSLGAAFAQPVQRACARYEQPFGRRSNILLLDF